MPINTYFDILNNNNIKSLFDIRNLITVKSISHGKNNWKDDAYNEIRNHSINSDEFEVLESISDSMLPIDINDLEELKKKYRDNQYLIQKINEKEEERKLKAKEIDKELLEKDNFDYDETQENLEANDLLDAEDEIFNNVSHPEDFLSIYEYENKIKTKRNPKVSLDTKLRTIGPNGAMKCEMCGQFESLDTRSFDTHHIIPLSEGGIDNVYNTVCLCGNCHKKMHGKIPFTYEQKGNMLKNIRKNIEKSTPYYIKNFDRLFNPNYNSYYNSDLSEEDLIEQYKKEEEYYKEHKEEEDEKFLTEWNSHKRK